MSTDCVLSGVFIYQHYIEFTIGMYQNTLLEVQPQAIYSGQSDIDGNFAVHFELAEPSIIIFSSLHDDVRIYIQPGDSVFLRMVNRQNIQFTGAHARENTILFEEGLSSDIFRSPPYFDQSVEEKLRIEFDIWNRRKGTLNTLNLDSDFEQFFRAEAEGRRYMAILSAIGENGSVDYPEYYQQLEAFGYGPWINETRSRSYNNCFALMWRMIVRSADSLDGTTILSEDPWYKDLHDAEYTTLLLKLLGYKKLYKMMSYVGITRMITHEEDTAALRQIYPLIDRLNHELPNQALAGILKQNLFEKEKKLKLLVPYDFEGTRQDSSPFRLSDIRTKYILIDFWATWCKPCMESLVKVNQYASMHPDSITVVAVNMSDSGSNWSRYLDENALPDLLHVKLNHEMSNRVFSEYYFNAVPNYVLLNGAFQFIVNGINKFDPEYFDYYIRITAREKGEKD